MTIDKAIEILEDLDTTLPQPDDRRAAVKLGIEALKRVGAYRHFPDTGPGAPLPGEEEYRLPDRCRHEEEIAKLLDQLNGAAEWADEHCPADRRAEALLSILVSCVRALLEAHLSLTEDGRQRRER